MPGQSFDRLITKFWSKYRLLVRSAFPSTILSLDRTQLKIFRKLCFAKKQLYSHFEKLQEQRTNSQWIQQAVRVDQGALLMSSVLIFILLRRVIKFISAIFNNNMGSEHSEFEEQFHHLYRFIGVINDKLFHSVKIYRRTKFNFDYIMLVERPLAEFTLINNTSTQ